jgi:hypothetical protein
MKTLIKHLLPPALVAALGLLLSSGEPRKPLPTSIILMSAIEVVVKGRMRE